MALEEYCRDCNSCVRGVSKAGDWGAGNVDPNIFQWFFIGFPKG